MLCILKQFIDFNTNILDISIKMLIPTGKSQKPHSAKKKFSKLFSRRVECDAEEVVVMKDNKPTTASKQKRPAPKPPESKETPPIVPEESATCSRQAITTKQAETISRTSETTKQTENFEYKAPTTSDAALLRGEQTIKQEHEDHREFIEHLFSAVTSNSGSEVMRTAVDDEAIDATDDERESLDYDDEDAGDHAAEFDNTTITTTPTANNDRSKQAKQTRKHVLEDDQLEATTVQFTVLLATFQVLPMPASVDNNEGN